MYMFVCMYLPKDVCVSMCGKGGGGVGGGQLCACVCRRPWMLSRLLLRTAVVHVSHRRQEEQATYQLSDHTLKNADVEHASPKQLSPAVSKHDFYAYTSYRKRENRLKRLVELAINHSSRMP